MEYYLMFLYKYVNCCFSVWIWMPGILNLNLMCMFFICLLSIMYPGFILTRHSFFCVKVCVHVCIYVIQMNICIHVCRVHQSTSSIVKQRPSTLQFFFFCKLFIFSYLLCVLTCALACKYLHRYHGACVQRTIWGSWFSSSTMCIQGSNSGPWEQRKSTELSNCPHYMCWDRGFHWDLELAK